MSKEYKKWTWIPHGSFDCIASLKKWLNNPRSDVSTGSGDANGFSGRRGFLDWHFKPWSRNKSFGFEEKGFEKAVEIWLMASLQNELRFLFKKTEKEKDWKGSFILTITLLTSSPNHSNGNESGQYIYILFRHLYILLERGVGGRRIIWTPFVKTLD